jgi:hypothetical protein
MRRIRPHAMGAAAAVLVACAAASAQTAPPVVVVDQAAASALAPSPAAPATLAAPALKPQQILVPAGTRLPLVLHNGISTRNAHIGDPVYLETLFPVLVEGRIVIPAGSYVSGEITETKRPGRVKGRGEIMLRLTSLILPNGYSVNFTGTPNGASSGEADEMNKEGRITGPSNKAGDTWTVVKTTGAGAGIGAIADGGKGAGIGAGIGALTGLAAVLFTRGPELQLPRGSTLDVSLDRPLYLEAARAQFTEPGHASTLAGPPNREPIRPATPF